MATVGLEEEEEQQAQMAQVDDDEPRPINLGLHKPHGASLGVTFVPDDEFNSFVSDFVKGGAAADAEFLDTFFDDIPSGFQEEDFGVVPVM